ncbi:exopolysaccharide biosynthesis polyprenyl glycosylphosphotransferase [Altericroceibacterium xinjiangense]|uniref:exopolysaccharide biosynthesis polyprenyl glycosylphosphotransferase n=1 Tax=Altericroceibacterium xinjiangense TaxID=762261 RepID=UPI001F49E0D9|nr:exopolysaccharide biosynthesis polyprenyl glycosylphosphotransferase [Altericroceibacterium xinjiangense]
MQVYLCQVVADILLLVGGAELAGLLYSATTGQDPVVAAQLLLPIYLTIALQNGTYSLESLTDWRTSSGKMLVALATAATLLTFVGFLGKFSEDISRLTFLLGLCLSAASMVFSRYVAVRLLVRVWGPSSMNILVIDAGGPPVPLQHVYRVSAAELDLVPTLEDPHALDRLARCIRNMDQVIVSCERGSRGDWAQVLKASGAHGEVLSDTIREIGALGVVRRGEMTSLLISTGPLGMRARAAKRLLDLIASAAALLLLSPILLAAALAIKLEDGGPIFFKQRRMGRSNSFFLIYKLRTMRVERADLEGNRSASKDDDRITRVGRFLRRTSIDELPQLINVLRGEMSLVGPRPHALGSQAGDKLFWEVDRRYWQRHCLKPGLTGLAQVRGFRGATPHELDLSLRLQADLEYLAGWSILRDCSILLATLRVVVHDRAF